MSGPTRRGSKLTLPLYLAASATSLFGNASIMIVLPWLVLVRTGDPAITGLVAAASAAPSAIAGFVGGHLADRIGRRTICVISDIGSALSVAALALVDATVGLNAAWFVALGVLGALFDVPGMTARQAMMADVASDSGTELDKVAAAESTLMGMSFLVGPAAAGLLLAILPAISVLWVTAACSGLAALLIAVMPLRYQFGAAETEEENSPLAGLRIVRRSPALLSLVIITTAGAVLVAPLLSVVLPAHFRSLNAPQELGWSLSSYALGFLAGAGVYGFCFARRRRAAWVIAQVMYCVGGLLIATLLDFWPVALGMAVAGIGTGLEQPVIQVLLAEKVPDAVRGRVFGVLAALQTLAAPVGLVAFAGLLAVSTLQVAAIVIGVAFAALSVYAVVAPALRPFMAQEPGATTDPA